MIQSVLNTAGALLLSVATVVGQASDRAAAFREALDAARQQMETDLGAAMAELDRLAAESIEARRTRVLSEAERAVHRDLFFWRGRGHLQLLANDKVEESFRELLRIDPLFASELSPREQQILDGIRGREAGLLEIASQERNAQVYVNGVSVGVTGDTPLRFTILAGEYEVRLEKEGYQPGIARVSVVAGQTMMLTELAPRRRVPPVAFLADRDEVEVILDTGPGGRLVPLASMRSQLSVAESTALDEAARGAKLEPSTAAVFLLRNPPVDRPMVVRFRRPCFVEETRSVAVTGDDLARVTPGDALLWFGDVSVVRLQPDVGTLRVTSTPSGSDVFVDGQLLGRTPFERAVCSGQHQIRLRHRIGSYSVTAVISRGRTELIDAVLKPGLAFLGGLETVGDTLRPSQELSGLLGRALSTITSFRIAARLELSSQVQGWSDAAAAELVDAADRADAATVMKLLRLAYDSYDAPLMIAAVRRPPADGEAPVDLLLFWNEHASADRIRWMPSKHDLTSLLAPLDRPADGADFVFENDPGVRVADIALPEVSLIVVQVEAGSPAAVAGVQVGDAVEAVDGMAMTAPQFLERMRQKRAGEALTLTVRTSGPARLVSVPLQRRPRRAPVFDPAFLGNGLIAKFAAASVLAATPADRELLGFNLALTYMRFGNYRGAHDLLAGLGSVGVGVGVGRGAVLFFRGRCLEALGEGDKAMALYQEAVGLNEPLVDDGTSVGIMAKRRLAALAR